MAAPDDVKRSSPMASVIASWFRAGIQVDLCIRLNLKNPMLSLSTRCYGPDASPESPLSQAEAESASFFATELLVVAWRAEIDDGR